MSSNFDVNKDFPTKRFDFDLTYDQPIVRSSIKHTTSPLVTNTFERKATMYSDSELQINQLERVFKQYDKDNSGRLDKAELKAMCKELGHDDSDEMVDKIIMEAEQNFDAQLSFGEFYRAFSGANLPTWYSGQYADQTKTHYTTSFVSKAREFTSPSRQIITTDTNLNLAPPPKIINHELRSSYNYTYQHQEIPEQVTALYAIISQVRGEASISAELQIQLQTLITRLIDEYNQINELSKTATIEIAQALIAEFEQTLSQINSLRVQIVSAKDEGSAVRLRFESLFSSLKIQITQLEESIAGHKAYYSEQYQALQAENTRILQLRAQEDKNHEHRLAEIHKQISEYRLMINRQVTEQDESYNGELRSQNGVISAQIEDEKNRVKQEKTSLMAYFDEKRGSLSNVEIEKMNFFRIFKEAVETKKAELMKQATFSKTQDEEKLRAARNDFKLSANDARLQQHQAAKSAVQLEMQEMREQLKREQELFVREKAEWFKQLEEHKTQTTIQIESERREHLRVREEQAGMIVGQLEAQKADLLKEFNSLNSSYTQIRSQIGEQRNVTFQTDHQWFVDRNAAIEAKKKELLSRLHAKQNSHATEESKKQGILSKSFADFHKDKSVYDSQLKQWNADEHTWTVEKGRVLNEIINLNVGGQHMSVSLANLMSVKGSHLELMFRNYHRHGLLKRDSQNRVYLDRDPAVFSRLLDYCAQNGKIEESKNPFERYIFQRELDFWKISKKSEFYDFDAEHADLKMTFKTDHSGQKNKKK